MTTSSSSKIESSALADALEQEKQNRLKGGKWLKEQGKLISKPLHIASLFGILGGATTLLFAAALATSINDAIQGTLNQTAILMVVASGILKASLYYAQQRVAFLASARLRTKLRLDLLHKFTDAGPVALSQQKSGELVTIALERIEALHNYYCNFIPQTRIVMVLPLIMLVTAFCLDWVVGLIFLITFPLVPLFMALIGRTAAAESEKQFAILTRMSGYFLDRLQGMTTIRIFNQDANELKTIKGNADLFRQGTMRVLRLAFLSSAVLEFFASLSVAGVAVYIGLSLLNLIEFGNATEMTYFKGLFLLIIAPEFYQPLRQLAAFYHDRASAIGAATALKPWFNANDTASPDAAECAETEFTPSSPLKDLTLQEYTFKWDGAQTELFKGVTLSAHPNEIHVIAGKSGIGKSTLINILAGFLSASSGTLSLNGIQHPSTALPLETLCLLKQKTHLFEGTIRDNIMLGAPNATEEEITAALNMAGLKQVIENLPDGIETDVGEAGAGFSGGQAQRLGIARAFLRNKDILLLDEPTAGLDPLTEQEILTHLKTLAQGKIVIMATHSPKAMQLATHLYTLKDQKLQPCTLEEIHA